MNPRRLTFVALVLAVTSCSSVPTYLVGGGSDGGVIEAGMDAGAVYDGAPDGTRPCASKPDGGHFLWFLSDGTWNGALYGASGGVNQVDAKCQQVGRARWPNTNWKAYFWHHPTDHPSARLIDACEGWWSAPSNGPEYRVFARRDALSNKPEGEVNVTENGESITSGALQIWTGGNEKQAMDRCDNWTSAGGAFGTTGDPEDKLKWMDQGPRGCDAFAHIYCIEQP